MTNQPMPPIAIVVSRYNDSITRALEEGAVRAYAEAGGDASTLGIFETAGAYELTAISHAAARSGLYRGVVALGCVIRGNTSHDRYINEAVAKGLTDITLKTGCPVAFGLLTVETQAQAEERAGGSKGNKGVAACRSRYIAFYDDAAAVEKAYNRSRDLVYYECHALKLDPKDYYSPMVF